MLGLKKTEIRTIVVTGLALAVGTVFFIPGIAWAKSKLSGITGNVIG